MAFNFEWENVAVVGRGGSSTVYKALVKPSGNFVAVKQIEIDGLSKDQINGIKGEIETMKSLSHTNILCYLGTQQNQSRIFIFLEYADRGSLRQYYQRSGPLTEPQIAYCMKGILSGLEYLHTNGIAHRDIKCANCLLCSDGTVKLADFGASKRFESDSIVSGLKGTPHWMAPEVIKGTQMTTGWMKADVWSLGCTVVEMFTAKVPYAEYENPMTAMYKIASGERPSLKPSSTQPNAASANLEAFMRACCEVEPTARPDVTALLALPFLVTEANVDLGGLFAVEPEPINAQPSASASVDHEAHPSRSYALNCHSEDAADSERDDGIERDAATALAMRRAPPTGSRAATAGVAAAAARPRTESRGSVDDETTIANQLDTSYTEEDYGWDNDYDEEQIDTPSRAVAAAKPKMYTANSLGGAPPTSTGAGIARSGQGIAEAGDSAAVPRSVPPPSLVRAVSSGSGSSSSTGAGAVPPVRGGHSRNRSREITINTTRSGAESPAPGMEDALTPSVHKDGNRKTSSVKVNMMPLLGQQVSGLSLNSAQGSSRALSRQWSADALPAETIEEEFEQVPDLTQTIPTSTTVTAEDTAEIPDETVEPPVLSARVVPSLIPTFENATEIYKNMMQKYSPRPTHAAAVNKPDKENGAATAAESTPSAESQPQGGGEHSGDSLSSGTEAPQTKPDNAVNDPPAPQAERLTETTSQAPTNNNTKNITSSGVSAPAPAPTKKSRSSGNSNKPNNRTLLETGKTESIDSAVVPKKPVEGPTVGVTVPSAAEAERPNAPLTGEMLRLHNNRAENGKKVASLNAAGGSAEVLDRIINQSSAAAVRRSAVTEIREDATKRPQQQPHARAHTLAKVEPNVRRVKDQPKGKGAQVHHTTAKSLKRARDKISPRGTGQDLLGANNQHTHVHEHTQAAVAGGIRSQSAGVHLSCEGGNPGYDPRQRLPPVLRGLVRGGVGSSSGTIEPIEEGQAVGSAAAVHFGPVSRYIQSAPAVSRSVNLPPINGVRHGGAGGAAGASGQGGGVDGSDGEHEGAVLTSQTPKLKQPRLHHFGRPTGPHGMNSLLQQSFAQAIKESSVVGGGGDAQTH